MTPPDSAYAYGAFLGAFQRGIEEMFRRINAGFSDAYNHKPLSEAQVEARCEARHRLRIAEERRKGLAYVKRIADECRRDLGLPR